jgi:hypothetical protein
MSQGFDPTKPIASSGVASEEVRTNFSAIASCHSGPLPPIEVQEGWLWLDTSNAPVYSLYQYVNLAWILLRYDIIGSSRREFYDSAFPVSGTWSKGDIVWNTLPTSPGYIGWVCITGSNPGPMAWSAFGAIA